MSLVLGAWPTLGMISGLFGNTIGAQKTKKQKNVPPNSLVVVSGSLQASYASGDSPTVTLKAPAEGTANMSSLQTR